jgi:hypothetical protein
MLTPRLMGLPVLTWLGTTFAGRVTASLLRAPGLEELIVLFLEEYEKLAVKFAQEPAAPALTGLCVARVFPTGACRGRTIKRHPEKRTVVPRRWR